MRVRKSILVGVHPGGEGAGRDVVLNRSFNRRHSDVGDAAIVQAAFQVVFLDLSGTKLLRLSIHSQKVLDKKERRNYPALVVLQSSLVREEIQILHLL